MGHTLHDIERALLRIILGGELIHAAVAFDAEEGPVSRRTVSQHSWTDCASLLGPSLPQPPDTQNRTDPALQNDAHSPNGLPLPSPGRPAPKNLSLISTLPGCTPDTNREPHANSPLPQPHNQLLKLLARRKTRHPPPARRAVLLRPRARAQRVPDHRLARGGRDFLGCVGQAADNGHASETATGSSGAGDEEGGGEAGGERGGAEGGEE